MGPKTTPKGMRDFLPEEMIARNEVMARIEEFYKQYGYRPIETPALEYLDTLRAKAGADIEGEIFELDGKELGLRFDLTVPLARVAATNAFPKPFKRYCISRAWRKEEPQRGRYREFWQADIDIVGSKSMRAEAELLSLTKKILWYFGFPEPKILLNNRKILDAVAQKLGFADKKPGVFRLLDKYEKLADETLQTETNKLIGPKATAELFELISAQGSNEEKLEIASKLSKDGAEELRKILELCDFEIAVDMTLARGLGYYTGPVFEIKLSKNMGTIAAGGRYDNLLSLYGQGDYATGISIGIERLITLINEQRGKDAKKKTYSRVFVANAKPEFFKYALKIADQLRTNDVEAEVDLNERNLRKQLEYANSLSIPYLIVVGEKEAKEEKVTFKNMSTGKEEYLYISDVIRFLCGPICKGV